MFKGRILGITSLLVGLFAVVPSSATYQLKSYDFGSGSADGSSASYRLDASTGTVSGSGAGTTYSTQTGEIPTQNTNTPITPTLTNPSSYYNRLQLVINTSNNPTDTKYLIAISPDSFATTYYVQTDNSIGSTLNSTNYQTYASWGGAGGFLILGLRPSTTYQVKIKAIQGRFSESGFSPVATSATLATSLSFSVATTATSTPPFGTNFSSLTPGTVFSSSADTLLGISTNALLGGIVYIKSANGGLHSTLASYTLNSVTADLSTVVSGYGAQVIATAQTSGGPLAAQPPYNAAANNVGAVGTILTPILVSSSPVTGATATIRTKAKTDFTVPSTTDYSDQLTFIASMSF